MEKNKAFTGILAIMLIAIIVQAVYIFHLKSKIKYRNEAEEIALPNIKFDISNPANSTPSFSFDFDNDFDIYKELQHQQKLLNRIFKNIYGMKRLADKSAFRSIVFDPEIDLRETKDSYILRMDIPGMEKDKINIEVKDRNLTISGERKIEKEEKNNHFFRQERKFGYFSRTITLPYDADPNKIKAEYKKGVLTITIGKIKNIKIEKKKAKKILII